MEKSSEKNVKHAETSSPQPASPGQSTDPPAQTIIIKGNTFYSSQVASSNPVTNLKSHDQENDAGASEDRKLQRDTELRRRLKKAASSKAPPPENFVPVQIMKYETEEREKFGSGFDKERRMPRETQSASMTPYNERQLFDEAGKVGENFVGVVGEPGIGKTSLVKVLMEHVSSGDSGDDCYVFYIPFKEMDFENDMTVFEFLASYLLQNWDFDSEQKDLLKKLSDSNNVYIFTDALDEANNELFSGDPKTITLYSKAKAHVIIQNLFSGHLLPKAKKLVTSRPDAFLNLHMKCKPKFNVNVLGLNKESQEKLCFQICHKDEQKHEKVQKILKLGSDFSALCTVPFYCQMIVKHLLRQSGTESSQGVTSTIIFTKVFRDYVISGEHLRGKETTLLELTNLALKGIKNDRFIFDVKDLKDGDVNQESLKNFVLSETDSDFKKKILPGSKRFFFVHLLWQEYFAALHLMFFADMGDFKDFMRVVGGDRWNAVAKFIFGCLNGDAKKVIQEIFCLSIKEDLLKQKSDAMIEYGAAIAKRASSGV